MKEHVSEISLSLLLLLEITKWRILAECGALTPAIPALEWLWQKDCYEFWASLGYRVRHCLRK